MTYQFDEIVDRSQNYAAKFEGGRAALWHQRRDPPVDRRYGFPHGALHRGGHQGRADQGIFGYTWRTPRYFETIAAWQQKRNGWLPDMDKMAFAPGVVPGMRMMLTMFSQPGTR